MKNDFKNILNKIGFIYAVRKNYARKGENFSFILKYFHAHKRIKVFKLTGYESARLNH